jgi:hypothetical protein
LIGANDPPLWNSYKDGAGNVSKTYPVVGNWIAGPVVIDRAARKVAKAGFAPCG